jgi:hypothetical protein
VSAAVGTRWFRHAGGVGPNLSPTVSGRYLSFAEREDIAYGGLRRSGCVRSLAGWAGRRRRSRGRAWPTRHASASNPCTARGNSSATQGTGCAVNLNDGSALFAADAHSVSGKDFRARGLRWSRRTSQEDTCGTSARRFTSPTPAAPTHGTTRAVSLPMPPGRRRPLGGAAVSPCHCTRLNRCAWSHLDSPTGTCGISTASASPRSSTRRAPPRSRLTLHSTCGQDWPIRRLSSARSGSSCATELSRRCEIYGH